MERIRPRGKKTTRTEQAVDAALCAQVEACTTGRSFILNMHEKEHLKYMEPAEGSTEIVMGEAVPVPTVDDSIAIDIIHDTLESPDSIGIDASRERTELLYKAQVLELGIDAANSVQAKNSLEKMLVHQMATCHMKSMEIFSQVAEMPRGREDLSVKMLNVAARMMVVYQQGMETLTKTRNNGKQTITVKKIQVTGGQNVIADNVNTKGGHGGE